MQVNPRVVREIFEICRLGGGVDRAEMLSVLTPDEREQVARGRGLPWDSFLRMVEHVYKWLGSDPERMRAVGLAALELSSQGFFLRLAKYGVPLRVMYEAERFNATANFPHLIQQMAFPQPNQFHLIGIVPPQFTPSEPMHYIMQGSLRALPKLLGLPPAEIELSEVTPARSETMFRVPTQPSLRRKIRQRFDAALHARETLEVYETQRKEIAEFVEAVDRATNELRAVLEALPGPVFLVRDGAIVWSNRAAEKTLGYETTGALVGRRFFEHVTMPDRAKAEEQMDRGARPGDSLVEICLLTRTGDEVPAELTLGETVTFEGAPAQLVVARDVSERVHMQRRLVTANRLASVGMLAAGVAHEINNPLSYIFWNLDVIARSLKATDPSHSSQREALDALTIVQEGVERVRNVVRDLRTLAQPDERAVEQVDVHAALESTLALVGRQLDAQTRVVRDYDLALPAVRANRARLGQVFLNLVTNATAAMESCGDARPHALTLRTRTHDASRVAIEIEDTGHGVAAEHVERIFEPFFTTKPVGRGTGLGLAICQRITTDLGGEISLSRTTARGTTFRLLLPAASS